MPVVSMDCMSNARIEPSSNCSFCMKTRFQISMKRSPSSSGCPEGRRGSCRHDRRRSRWQGAAGTGRAHLPEIVRCRDTDDAVVGQARDLLPDLHGLIVGVIDGDQQAILGDREIAGQQLPGMRDRLVLEIVAEAEVAQHLEERVVPRRIAHIVQVVVLAAGTNAFLRAGRAVVVARLDPVNRFLNCTMPEFANISVGSLRGTAGCCPRPVAVPFEIAKESRADVIQTGMAAFIAKVSPASRAADGLSPGRCPVQQPACEKAQGLPRARPS